MLLLSLACLSGSIVLDPVDTGSSLVDDPIEDPVEEEEGPSNALSEAMTTEGLMRHLEAFQAIADESNETRAWTTQGHQDSREYIIKQLEQAGYEVEEKVFAYEEWLITQSELLVDGEELDYAVFDGSATGDIEGSVVSVDLMLPPGEQENSSTSGCEPDDFTGFPSGAIALIQRGSCTFLEKVENAQDAGAVGVIIFNEGQQGRRGIVEGTTGELVDVPVVGISFQDGAALAELSAFASILIEGELESWDLVNVVAETPGGQDDSVILIGAHLDSVPAGPGINDNGSGSALVLEMALQIAELGLEPENRVRFAWWDGEEYGLLGSIEYAENLRDQEVDEILAYLNFDMVASPNGIPFLYDGDASNTGLDFGGRPAPAGSDIVEWIQQEWYDGRALQYSEVSPDIPSDSWWFLANDVPLGGTFTGADSVKSVQEANVFGGSAGEPYDSCYHQRCDSLDNLDEELFLMVARSSAYMTEELMMRTDSLN